MNVSVTDRAVQDIEELPTTMQERVLTVVERLEKWPAVSGAKSLTGQWKGCLRVRTGAWRVIFTVADDELIVIRVAHRREVYD